MEENAAKDAELPAADGQREELDEGVVGVAVADEAEKGDLVGDGVPDFAQFLEEVEGEHAEATSKESAEVAHQRELAQVVQEMLNGAGGSADESGDGVVVPKRDGRRLLFQGGLVGAAQVCPAATTADGAAISPGRSRSTEKRPSLFSTTRTFFKTKVGKALTNPRGSEGEVAGLPSFADVKHVVEALAAGGEEKNAVQTLTQVVLFDDLLVLARPSSKHGTLVPLAAMRLEDLSIRDVGSPVYVFEEPLSDDDGSDSEGDEQGAGEDSAAAGMDLASNMLEVRDALSRCSYLLDTGGSGHKAMWLDQLLCAIEQRVVQVAPVRTAALGWRHEILRGTLWAAAREGNVSQVGRILRHHCDAGQGGEVEIDAVDQEGATALHYAAWSGRALIAKQLLAKGAQANSLDNELATPLHLAAGRLHAAAVRALAENGADVDARDLKDETPMLRAWERAETNLAAGVDTGATKAALVELVEALGAAGADLEWGGLSGRPPLLRAAESGDADVVTALLNAGAAPDGPPGQRCTPLSALCRRAPPNLVLMSKLLTWGANPNAQDEAGNTPLYVLALLRAQGGFEEDAGDAAALLVSFGARPGLVCGPNGVGAPEILAPFGAELADAERAWAAKTEPACVRRLAQTHPYRIPFATQPGATNWENDESVARCKACATLFRLMVRRHHCRRCGRVVCASCCSKQFTLRNPSTEGPSAAAAGTPEQVKVCVSCFNALGRSLSVAARDLVGHSVGQGDLDRDRLFSGARAPSQRPGAGSTPTAKGAAKPEASVGLAARAHQALQQAQESLAERGERLSRLADSSAAMNNNAANFSSIARQLREREEKKAGWFGSLF